MCGTNIKVYLLPISGVDILAFLSVKVSRDKETNCLKCQWGLSSDVVTAGLTVSAGNGHSWPCLLIAHPLLRLLSPSPYPYTPGRMVGPFLAISGLTTFSLSLFLVRQIVSNVSEFYSTLVTRFSFWKKKWRFTHRLRIPLGPLALLRWQHMWNSHLWLLTSEWQQGIDQAGSVFGPCQFLCAFIAGLSVPFLSSSKELCVSPALLCNLTGTTFCPVFVSTVISDIGFGVRFF